MATSDIVAYLVIILLHAISIPVTYKWIKKDWNDENTGVGAPDIIPRIISCIPLVNIRQAWRSYKRQKARNKITKVKVIKTVIKS